MTPEHNEHVCAQHDHDHGGSEGREHQDHSQGHSRRQSQRHRRHRHRHRHTQSQGYRNSHSGGSGQHPPHANDPNAGTGCAGQNCGEASSSRTDVITHDNIDTVDTLIAEAAKRVGTENSAAGPQHVLLSATGLDCSGCGNQLAQELNDMPGIANVRVNFVVGHADFDITDSNLDVNEVIRRVHRATGFKCARIRSQDTYVDVLMNKDDFHQAQINAPDGVLEIDRWDKKTVRIRYDPHVIGCRKLVTSEVPRGLANYIKGLAAPDHMEPGAVEEKNKMYAMLGRTFVAAILTIPVCIMSWGKMPSDPVLRGCMTLFLATLVQTLSIFQFYIPAFSVLWYSRRVEMDMLVVISISAAYIYSLVAVIFSILKRPLDTTEIFETSTLLITLVLLGRLIAAVARVKAVKAVSTRSLQPNTATISSYHDEVDIDSRLLQFDDVFVVGPHTQVPTDGVIVEGITEIDESMITGESIPVKKHRGMQVIAGTMNGTGSVKAKLTRLPGRNTVTDIAGLVDEAAYQKPKVQALADRVAGWFVPVVFTVALIVWFIWLGICFGIRHQPAGGAIGTSITYAIAVLAISCPCALGLAVPMVLAIAGGVAAKYGVVIKSSETLEFAHKVTDVVFDKTGTLTGGLSVVLEEFPVSGSTDLSGMREAYGITKALVRDNKHPVSVAMTKILAKVVANENVKDLQSIPGCGIEAKLGDSTVRAGNAHWLKVEHLQSVARCIDSGMTTLCVMRDSSLVAVFGLKCILRPEAPRVVRELQRRDIEVHVVSGDEDMAVEEVAIEVGIAPSLIMARQTPAEKSEYIKQLTLSRNYEGKERTVLFCGDGTNDAIAVAQANVGVQLGSSSDLTRATADVVLLASNLELLLFFLDISRAAFWRIVVNFVWAALYNVIAILLAAGAFVTFRIPPAYAGLGELVSVLPVVFIAATLGIRGRRRSKRNRKEGGEPGSGY